jgi:hypothetical protein
MKKALIDENSVVAQVADEVFDVASPCFWVDCADDVVAYAYKYENGAVVPIPNPAPVPPTAEKVREMRNKRLLDSDWTQLADAPLDKQAWAVYRQSLRDLPNQSGFPANVSWPQKP